MDRQLKVWISSKQGAGGKRLYSLRWMDGAHWRSKPVGTSRRLAEAEAAKMRVRVDDGSFVDVHRITWKNFLEDFTDGMVKSESHRAGVRQTLEEFGTFANVPSPDAVQPASIRNYVQWLIGKGNAAPTINRKLRNLRLSLRAAVDYRYVTRCPVLKSHWVKETPKDDEDRRILQPEEEPKLLASADKLYGPLMRGFIEFALDTWGRFSEITKLRWADIEVDEEPGVLFRATKSHENRYVPIRQDSPVVDTLRRLRLRFESAGRAGPFAVYADKSNFHKRWGKIIEDAGIEALAPHDLRRTGITRALLDNVPITVVTDLAGHKNITTTMRYYKGIKRRDLRAAIERRKIG